MADITSIIDCRHPTFRTCSGDWFKWRLTYDAGDDFKFHYLRKFETREDNIDFEARRDLTPVPAFAKSAINDIRNSIFQRMRDISRNGGSDNYRRAISGAGMGVDRRGNTMNAFLGQDVLTDLLVMGRVGVFIDNPIVQGPTLAHTSGVRPYLYKYAVEDILSWSCAASDNPSEFSAVLLRDTSLSYDEKTMLPSLCVERYRRMWIDPDTGKVNLQFYDQSGVEINPDGSASFAPIELELTRIPFVMLDIGDSLIKDVCNHQVALLNLTSRDVWFAIQSCFTFYTEQRDLRGGGNHLKMVADQNGTATTGGQGAADNNITIGTMHGRAYGLDMDRPGYISPPTEPLKASIALQEKLEGDIRKLVNLAVQAVASRSSAEAKSLDNAGLEAGLSFIGLVLESGERQIAQHWACYESRVETSRQVATIKYPDRYSLKTDADRIDEATKLSKLMFSLPGRKVKREIAKQIVQALLGGRVDVNTIDAISDEISSSKYLTSDPDTIIAAVEAGLCGNQTGSQALGFEDDEYLAAEKDLAARTSLTLAHQTSPGENPAARGAPDLAPNPILAAAAEKTGKAQRGRSRRSRTGQN